MEVRFMRTFTITSLMSSLHSTPQLMLHLLCPLSSVINVVLPSLCTTRKAEFGALWHNSFKPTKELPTLCDCSGCKSPAEPALGDLQLYNLPTASNPSGQTFISSTIPSNSRSSSWNSLFCFHSSWLQLLCFPRSPPCFWDSSDFFLDKK